MAGAARIASRIDLSKPLADQRAKSTTETAERPVVFTESQLQDTSQLAKQLTALSLQMAQITQAQRSHPEQAPLTFENVECGDSGDKVVLHHNFGRFAECVVTSWKSYPLPAAATVLGHSLVSDIEEAPSTRRTDENKLALRSYVAGVATIRVYAGG